ncbi:MAG: PAS domain-containing protein [Magnetococcales bacterium]|nr:PAS domain-containing protein [Magnetococcales bacterium]
MPADRIRAITSWNSYILLFLLIVAMGGGVIFQMERLAHSTDQLYQKLFMVNLAAQHTKSALLKMQIILHDLIHDDSDEAVQRALQEALLLKESINVNLETIESRFSGNDALLADLREACSRGRVIHQHTVDLLQTGDRTEAMRNMKGMQELRREKLDPLIDQVIRFSETKADELYQEALTRQSHVLFGSFIFVSLMIVMSLLILRQQYRHFQNIDKQKQAAMNIIQQNILDMENSENRLWGVINNSNAMISLKDRLGRYILVSRRFEEMFGITHGQIRGNSGVDLLPRAVLDQFLEHEQQVRQQDRLVEREIDIPHPSGLHTFLSVKFPLHDGAGVLQGVGSIDTDITHRKQMEASLQQTNDILEALFQTSHMAMVILDREFNFIRVNRAYADKNGAEIDFFPGKNHFALYPHVENEIIFRRVVATGEPFSVMAKPFEFPDHPEWGVTYWDWTLHPLFDTERQVVCLLFTLLDVTIQERNALELQNTNVMLRTILDTIPSLVYWKDVHAVFRGCNRAFAQHLGLDDPERIIDRRNDEFPQVYGNVLHDRDDQQVIATGNPVGPFSEFFQHPDGTSCWISTTKIPLKNTEGQISGMLGISEDITITKRAFEERAQLQDQACRNDRLASIGFLAAGIAHEVNNPNNIIVLNSSMIQEIWIDSKKILDNYYRDNGDFSLGGMPYSEMADSVSVLIRGIEENARRIHSIVKNLKALTQSQDMTEMQSTDLCEVIEQAVSFLQERIKRTTRLFQTEWQPDRYLVQGNSEKLFLVFTNLIMNALQSLPGNDRGVTIAMSMEPMRETIRIEVRDQGCGIALEHMARLGTPFFTTRQSQGGMGIGLSIIHRIIESHNGTLKIDSNLGLGTTVTIHLPIARRQP